MVLYLFLKVNEYMKIFSFPCSVGNPVSLVARHGNQTETKQVNFL